MRHSLAAIAGKISYLAWQHIPTTYLACFEHKVLLPEWQAKMMQAVKDSGTEIEVDTYNASHSPFLSLTDEMVAAVESVAAKYT